MSNPGELQRENQALRDRLSRLSAASLRINESLDFETVLQGALDSACSLTGARYGVIALAWTGAFGLSMGRKPLHGLLTIKRGTTSARREWPRAWCGRSRGSSTFRCGGWI